MWKIQWKMWIVYSLSQSGAAGAFEKNSKFLLIVAELELTLRGVAEVICRRLSEGEASRRGTLDGCEWWGTYSK